MSKCGDATRLCRPSVAKAERRRPTTLVIYLTLMVIVSGCREESAEKPPDTAKREASEATPQVPPEVNHAPTVTEPVRPTSDSSVSSEPTAAAIETQAPGSRNVGTAIGRAPLSATGKQKQLPTQAYASADDLRKKATNAARQGNIEAAYGYALHGWEAVREHDTDPQCRKLAAQLLQELEVYGERISADSGDSSLGGKPLRIE